MIKAEEIALGALSQIATCCDASYWAGDIMPRRTKADLMAMPDPARTFAKHKSAFACTLDHVLCIALARTAWHIERPSGASTTQDAPDCGYHAKAVVIVAKISSKNAASCNLQIMSRLNAVACRTASMQ